MHESAFDFPSVKASWNASWCERGWRIAGVWEYATIWKRPEIPSQCPSFFISSNYIICSLHLSKIRPHLVIREAEVINVCTICSAILPRVWLGNVCSIWSSWVPRMIMRTRPLTGSLYWFYIGCSFPYTGTISSIILVIETGAVLKRIRIYGIHRRWDSQPEPTSSSTELKSIDNGKLKESITARTPL